MRTLLTLFLVTVGFGAVAQRGSYSKTITTDGQRLHIRVDVRDPARPMHYERSFDVSRLSRAEVNNLEKFVLDSLTAATEPAAMVLNGRVPYEKTVEENRPEGRLKIRLTFRADGQENIIERTAIIRDATEAGRRKLHAEIERQLIAELEALVGGPAGV